MGDEAVVRRAVAADEDAVVAGLRLDFLAAHRGVEVGSFGADFAAATAAWVVAGHGDGSLRTWLAAPGEGGRPVGAVSALRRVLQPRPGEQVAAEDYVLNLWVVPTWRRQGIGRRLFDAVLGDARADGVRQVVLHTTDVARPLYEAAGFRPDDRWLQLRLDG